MTFASSSAAADIGLVETYAVAAALRQLVYVTEDYSHASDCCRPSGTTTSGR